MVTKVEINVGFDEQIISSLLKQETPEYSCVFFKFDCENPEIVAEKLRETVQCLKDFIGELGETPSMIANSTEVIVRALDDGVAIIVNAETHPMFAPYVGMAMNTTEAFKSFNPKIKIQVGSSKCLTEENLIGGSGFVHVGINSKSVVDAILNQTESLPSKNLEEQLKVAIKQKFGIETSLFLSLLNMESLDICLKMYKADESNILTKVNLKEKIFGVLQMVKQNPMFAVVESMEFLKEAIETLRDNGISGMHVGAQLGSLVATYSMNANIGFVFDELFKEEED